MNKRTFFLILTLLVLMLAVSFKFYLNSKKEFLDEYNHYLLIKKRIKEIEALKEKYNTSFARLKYLKKFCTLTFSEPYKIECKNLDKKQFDYVQNLIFKNSFKLKKFDITKDKNISLDVEIEK